MPDTATITEKFTITHDEDGLHVQTTADQLRELVAADLSRQATDLFNRAADLGFKIHVRPRSTEDGTATCELQWLQTDGTVQTFYVAPGEGTVVDVTAMDAMAETLDQVTADHARILAAWLKSSPHMRPCITKDPFHHNCYLVYALLPGGWQVGWRIHSRNVGFFQDLRPSDTFSFWDGAVDLAKVRVEEYIDLLTP